MKDKLIKVVSKRYPNVSLDDGILFIIYDNMLKKSPYSIESGMDEYYYYYFELAKAIEKYIVDKIISGDEDYLINFIYDNNYVVNMFLGHYELYETENVVIAENVLFDSIFNYNEFELFSVQVIRNMKKEFFKVSVKSKK